MIKYDIKTYRTLIRLSVFCIVFAAFSAAFGIAYVYEHDVRLNMEQTAVTRAHGELYGYLSGIGGVLTEMRTAQPAEIIILTSKLNMLSGGAKSTLVAIPFSDSGRTRLQSFLTDCVSYSLDLSGRLICGELPSDSDTAAIEGYISFADSACQRLYGCVTDDGSISNTALKSIRIDTPPLFYQNSDYTREKSVVTTVPESEVKITARRYLGEYGIIRRVASEPSVIRFSNGCAFVDIIRRSGDLIRLSSCGVFGDGLFSCDIPDALQKAERFLAELGLGSSLMETYEQSSGRLNAVYSYRGSNIFISVSLENGRIIYFDASDFYL